MSESASKKVADINVSMTELGAAIAAGIQSTQRKKVTFQEFQERRPKRHMPVTLIHNGRRVDERAISSETIALLSKLRPGKYIKTRDNPAGRVEVIRDNSKNPPIVAIKHPVRQPADRMENLQHWRTFHELIQRLTTEEPVQF